MCIQVYIHMCVYVCVCVDVCECISVFEDKCLNQKDFIFSIFGRRQIV